MKNNKKVKRIISNLILISCFMVVHRASAQSWGSTDGDNDDIWVVNQDNTNHWSYLRLQTSNNRGWNMVNQGDLWWGFSTSSSHTNTGTEKMRLTTDGNLGINITAPTGKLHIRSATGSDTDKLLAFSEDNTAQFFYEAGFSGAGSNGNTIKLKTTWDTNPMTWRGNGNVGIGTITPETKLHIEGGSDASLGSGGYLLMGATSGTNLIMDDNEIMARDNGESSTFYLQSDGGDFLVHNNESVSQKFIVKDDGKVGIGTIDPETKLHIEGGADAGLDSGGYLITGSISGANLIMDSNEIMARNNGTASPFYVQAEGGDFIVHHSGADSNAFVVKDNGEVGIGTSVPVGKLHIRSATGSDSDKLLIFSEDDTAQFFYEAGFSGTGSNGNYIKLKTTWDTNPMTWRGNGNVGIGTTNPSEKLEVAGTVKATSFVSSAASFPDYVFAKHYKITPLSELETYVTQHHHLPNMPSEKEVVEQGLNVPDVVIRSVENIETIYLHLIRMEKEIKALQKENTKLKQQLQQGR